MRAIAVMVAVSSCVGAAMGFSLADSVKERVLNLSFVPQESTGEHAPSLAPSMATRSVSLSSFRDDRPRSEADLVGEGTDDDDHPFPWRASGSVVDFARGVFVRTASGWGIRLEDGQDLLLTVRLVRYYVQEKDQAVGSTYASDVRIGFELKTAAGKTLSSGVVSGSAHRYGRKRSADNCNEVLSDALKEAYAGLFDDASLQAAWSGTRTHPGTTGRTISAPALLAELVKLRSQGLGPEVLIGYVKQQTLSPPLSAQDVIDWKGAGMSESVIAAALERASEGM